MRWPKRNLQPPVPVMLSGGILDSDILGVVERAQKTQLAALKTASQKDGPQFADGSRWLWQAAGTPDGGTILAAADGGVWVREFHGPLTPQMFGVYPGTGDVGPALNRICTVAVQRSLDLDISGGVFKTSVRILHNGGRSVRIYGTGTIESSDLANPVFVLGDTQNVHLSGLTLRHAGISGPTRNATPGRTVNGHGLLIDGARDATIDGLTIEQATGIGMLTTNSQRVLISGNTVRNTLADGIHTTGGSTDVRVIGNMIRGVGDDGIAVVSYESDPVQTARVSITGNQVDGTYARGITNVGGDSVLISGNTVRNTVAAGIKAFTDVGFKSRRPSNTIIANNQVALAGNWTAADVEEAAHGIFADGTTNLSVSGNQVAGSKVCNLYLAALGLVVSNNQLDGGGGSNTIAGGVGAVINGNRITDCPGHALLLVDNEGAQVSGNRIRGCGGVGIFVQGGADVNVNNNTVAEASQGGDRKNHSYVFNQTYRPVINSNTARSGATPTLRPSAGLAILGDTKEGRVSNNDMRTGGVDSEIVVIDSWTNNTYLNNSFTAPVAPR